MTFRQLAMIVLGVGVLSLPAPASTRHMPIEEVRPGMIGVGRTVFKGTAVEEFRPTSWAWCARTSARSAI